MGTKELLLIVLGVIIVGVAIVTGINFSRTSFDEQVIEMAKTRVLEIGGYANQYFNKPEDLGGGGGSYRGFSLPDEYQSDPDWRIRANANRRRVNITLVSRSRTYENNRYRIRGQIRKEGLWWLQVQDPISREWIFVYDSRD